MHGGLKAASLKHLKKQGFSLFWNTCVEIWLLS